MKLKTNEQDTKTGKNGIGTIMRISLSEEQTRWKFWGATMLLVDTRLERNNSMYNFTIFCIVYPCCKLEVEKENQIFFSFLFFIYRKTRIFKFSSTLNACGMSFPAFPIFWRCDFSFNFFFFPLWCGAHHKIDTKEHTMDRETTFTRIEWNFGKKWKVIFGFYIQLILYNFLSPPHHF